MPPGLPGERSEQEGRVWIGVALLLAAALRGVFAIAFPTIHGGDAAARLAHSDQLILGYQLPLPQLFVALGKALLDDPLLVRLTFCLWGAILVAGFTALLGLVVNRTAALFGCLLLASDPLLTHYSIVPYQESVAYGLLAWAFYFAASDRQSSGAFLMAAACFSRYEVWLFLPAFAWVTRSRKATLIAGLPLLAWTAWWRGLAPRGLYVVDLDLSSSRLSRIAFLTRKFVEYETAFVVILAGLALAFMVLEARRAILKFTAVLVIVIVLVVAFGHEFPPGSGLMSERLIHLPVLLCLPLAAVCLERISSRSRLAFTLCIAATLLFAERNVRFEKALLEAAALEPDLALARGVALAIESLRSSDECVSVHAPSVEKASLDAYIGKVGAAFGDVQRARLRAASLATASPDRDRIAAQLRASTGTVRSEAGCPLLVLIDELVGEETRERTERTTLVAEITAGRRRARILRSRR